MVNENEIPSEVILLVAAMNLNNAYANGASSYGTAYAGYEITEVRTKYFLLNSVLTNGQRSGVFLIDRKTLDVFHSRAYGKAGRKIDAIHGIIADYNRATASYKNKGVEPKLREIPANPMAV
jgi:hypothetical protein